MSDYPDLFDLLRSKSNELEQAPSDQAWLKLERRLDRRNLRPRRRVRPLVSWTSAAAAVFLFATLAMGLFLIPGRAAAPNGMAATPATIEEMTISANPAAGADRYRDAALAYAAEATAIEEGAHDRVLRLNAALRGNGLRVATRFR
ncbi:MAG: hypothetical protein WBA17_06905 [Saprospiraceae bacterium]